MLRSIKELQGYNILAQDEEFGKAKDLLFDDEEWIVRYLVIDTGNWIPGKKVIIPPEQLDKPDWAERIFPVKLSKKAVIEGPALDEDEPVSRRYEKKLYSFFGWNPYWLVGIPENVVIGQMTHAEQESRGGSEEEPDPEEETDLRSSDEVMGYHIHATDGSIGHVEDIIMDDEGWRIRYIVVDTRNWLPGKKVLVAISWIHDIKWLDKEVYVDLDRESIKESPEYDPSAPINREYEEKLYDFYGRPRYWI